MQQAGGVRTGGDGTFKLDSLKSLSFLRSANWHAVTVSFQHQDYLLLKTNYTVADATNTTTSEPLVVAGDILLRHR